MADKKSWRVQMPVQIICPNLKCRKILAVPDEFRGKSVKCQYCQTVLRVPGAAKPAATAVAAKTSK